MASFRLMRPPCPCCGSAQHVVLEKTVANCLRVAAATILGFLGADVVPLRWRCTQTGNRFVAVSANVI